jgi:hypothetical protein
MANDNAKLFARDVLLWSMVKHASRHGDVGTIEDLLPFWVCIWMHTGQHKYAENMTQFLLNLKQVWPKKFAHVVRMNWLVNPKGVANGFRGADWVVERNNLMHKVIHAGSGSSRTLDNIIEESPLIRVYQQALELVEQNFHITQSTLHHAPLSMENTLGLLQLHVQDWKMHSHIRGRVLSTLPANAIIGGLEKGLKKLQKMSSEPEQDESESEGEGKGSQSDGTSVATASDCGDE